ncbi:MAG TPA: YggS family pyridoxal phosphate-dependent enzyme [Firmicutes bacterium]|nr:YggS family pyridoxal phosphate-dependent enzyme [Candidatus Fermentithermobacillaceae bacterium]
MTENSIIKHNLKAIERKIEDACRRSKRDPDSVRIMAVSKTFPKEIILEAKSCGITYFGENRVQEGRAKKEEGAFEGAKVALIGHLQTNKASMAVRVFDEVQTVDSIRVAQALSKFSERYREEDLPVYVQVNVARDPDKYGCMPEEALELTETVLELPGLMLVGLMTIAPFSLDPQVSRNAFRDLRNLRDHLVDRGIPEANLKELSMGMSSDYEIAVEEGSTVVRIGTQLFGARS